MNAINWTLGDTNAVTATLTDGQGSAIDLTGASVRFVVEGEVDDAVEIISAAAGRVKYEPVTTLGVGSYTGRFVVTFADLTVLSVPNTAPYLKITITQP